MRDHTYYVLKALIHATGLKTTGPRNGLYYEVVLTKNNIKKIIKIAASMKYEGSSHLFVELKGYSDIKWLRLWAENNDSTYLMTLINIEHGLDSLI